MSTTTYGETQHKISNSLYQHLYWPKKRFYIILMMIMFSILSCFTTFFSQVVTFAFHTRTSYVYVTDFQLINKITYIWNILFIHFLLWVLWLFIPLPLIRIRWGFSSKSILIVECQFIQCSFMPERSIMEPIYQIIKLCEHHRERK